MSRESYAEAIGFYERALALDPRSVAAQSSLATALAARVLSFITDTAEADILRAEGLAQQALAASLSSPAAHFAKGQVLRAQRRYEEAIPEYETVLAADRNWVTALFALGQCKLFAGSIEETTHSCSEPSGSAPAIPSSAFGIGRSGWCTSYNRERTKRAVGSKKRATPLRRTRVSTHPSPPPTPSAARPNALPPNSPKHRGRRAMILLMRKARSPGSWEVPKVRDLYEATYFAGLRKAGMPEE